MQSRCSPPPPTLSNRSSYVHEGCSIIIARSAVGSNSYRAGIILDSQRTCELKNIELETDDLTLRLIGMTIMCLYASNSFWRRTGGQCSS